MEGERQEVERDIERVVSEALARFGVAGHVEIAEDSARLIGHGLPVRAPIGLLREDWPNLAHDLRRRRATELARQLVALRRASQPANASHPSSRSRWAPLVLIALVLGGFVAYLKTQRHQDLVTHQPIPLPNSSVQPNDRDQRAAEVCQATQERVTRGATVGPTDVEGWQVELTLLRPGTASDFAKDPELHLLVESLKKNGSAPSAQLFGIDLTGTSLTWHTSTFTSPTGSGWHELRLGFHGSAVALYFREERRVSVIRLVAALSDRLQASHAALYARCERGTAHHLGSWFRGPGPEGATVALLYAMGGWAEGSAAPPASAIPQPQGSGAILDGLERITRPLSRSRLAPLVGKQDGMIAGGPVGPCVVTFPFRDGSRASRSSLEIARYLGLDTP